MSNITLYQMTNDFNALLDSDDDISNALADIVSGEIEAKAENVCKFLSVLESSVEQFKVEEKRIAERRKALENKAQRVKEYIKECMLNGNIDKMQAGTFRLSVSLTAGTLEIDDIAQIPQKYLTIVTNTIPDKTAIKAALKAGENVPGCHIEAGTSLRIR